MDGRPTLFRHGYALLIGIDDNQVPHLRLPAVAKDTAGLHGVLIHPDRCAYPEANVRRIQGSMATRSEILAGLIWLRKAIEADDDATIIIYYSGHGYCDVTVDPPDYYFVPYDVVEHQLRLSCLPAKELARELRQISPKRLLIVLDCCHASGMDAKSPHLAPPDWGAMPVRVFGPSSKSINNLEQLQAGHGRAVLSSSQENQPSYVRSDGNMSVFTYHLIEALTGHAQPAGGALDVLVSDVLSYVHRHVPMSAKKMGCIQNPEFELSGNFPIALVVGGKGVAIGESAPDPLATLPTVDTLPQIVNAGSSAVAQGAGAIAASEHSAVIGMTGGQTTIATGDNVQISHRTDSVKGDKITVGDISGASVIAIGRNARAASSQKADIEEGGQ